MGLELCLLIVGRCCCGHSLVLIVGCLDSNCGTVLISSFCLYVLLLLVLDIGSRHLHTENDVSDLELSQAGRVHVVLLSVVINHQIF